MNIKYYIVNTDGYSTRSSDYLTLLHSQSDFSETADIVLGRGDRVVHGTRVFEVVKSYRDVVNKETLVALCLVS